MADVERTVQDHEHRIRDLERKMEDLARQLKKAQDEAVKRAGGRAS
jgi:predicted  nucleic acid-binding Zn-ribbon protein